MLVWVTLTQWFNSTAPVGSVLWTERVGRSLKIFSNHNPWYYWCCSFKTLPGHHWPPQQDLGQGSHIRRGGLASLWADDFWWTPSWPIQRLHAVKSLTSLTRSQGSVPCFLKIETACLRLWPICVLCWVRLRNPKDELKNGLKSSPLLILIPPIKGHTWISLQFCVWRSLNPSGLMLTMAWAVPDSLPSRRAQPASVWVTPTDVSTTLWGPGRTDGEEKAWSSAPRWIQLSCWSQICDTSYVSLLFLGWPLALIRAKRWSFSTEHSRCFLNKQILIIWLS